MQWLPRKAVLYIVSVSFKKALYFIFKHYLAPGNLRKTLNVSSLQEMIIIKNTMPNTFKICVNWKKITTYISVKFGRIWERFAGNSSSSLLWIVLRRKNVILCIYNNIMVQYEPLFIHSFLPLVIKMMGKKICR